MRIGELLTVNERLLAVCSGEDITPETKCSRFEQNGKVYETKGSSLCNSFTGVLQLFLLLPNGTDVQKGEITIID